MQRKDTRLIAIIGSTFEQDTFFNSLQPNKYNSYREYYNVLYVGMAKMQNGYEFGCVFNNKDGKPRSIWQMDFFKIENADLVICFDPTVDEEDQNMFRKQAKKSCCFVSYNPDTMTVNDCLNLIKPDLQLISEVNERCKFLFFGNNNVNSCLSFLPKEVIGILGKTLADVTFKNHPVSLDYFNSVENISCRLQKK